MSYAYALSFPPHVHLTPLQPIAPSHALTLIQRYLSASGEHPYLHPDCHFVEHGIQLNNPIESGGLILHQLRRVEAGLRGERLSADVLLVDGAGEQTEGAAGEGAYAVARTRGVVDALPEGDDSRLDTLLSGHDAVAAQPDAVMPNVSMNYQEQMAIAHTGQEQGDVGDRHNAVRNRDAVPAVRDASRKDEWGEEDKEARKRAKKERRKTEQRERERVRGNEVVAVPWGAVGAAAAATETGGVKLTGAEDPAVRYRAEQLPDDMTKKSRHETAAGLTTINRLTEHGETHDKKNKEKKETKENEEKEETEKKKEKKEKKEKKKRKSLLEAAGLASKDNHHSVGTVQTESAAAQNAFAGATDGADGGDREARKKRKKDEAVR